MNRSRSFSPLVSSPFPSLFTLSLSRSISFLLPLFYPYDEARGQLVYFFFTLDTARRVMRAVARAPTMQIRSNRCCPVDRSAQERNVRERNTEGIHV